MNTVVSMMVKCVNTVVYMDVNINISMKDQLVHTGVSMMVKRVNTVVSAMGIT